jgi:type I restriction enzyme M protein
MIKKTTLSQNGAGLGIESKLWNAADKMRGSMDATEYKHVALGLLFLKYISDKFEMKHKTLKTKEEREDRDEYIADNIFWVPQTARWGYLRDNATAPTIGKLIDEAMITIERENKQLKGVLPKDYARPSLDKVMLGGLINIFSDLDLYSNTEQDVLGRVYEYFLKMFASAEGKRGGEFYTPRSIVKLIVEVLKPFSGRIYDPCCGSGGMFVSAGKFVSERSGCINNISVYGQESNPATWRLAKMNLAIRGIEADLGDHADDTFHNDLHKDLKVDFIMANPPFNISDWGGERLRNDVRWKYGVPPIGNANYAWIEHMLHHLSPNGKIGLVLANGSMSTSTSGEGEIRKKIIDADLVDCMIALPPQLFYSVTIPVCLWFLSRNKTGRRGKTLFIDARKMGYMATRNNRDFTDEDIIKIANTYHNWADNKDYVDIAGFCKGATITDIVAQGYVLTPGRYVGMEDVVDNDGTFNEKMERLTVELSEQMRKSVELDIAVREQLAKIGWGL